MLLFPRGQVAGPNVGLLPEEEAGFKRLGEASRVFIAGSDRSENVLLGELRTICSRFPILLGIGRDSSDSSCIKMVTRGEFSWVGGRGAADRDTCLAGINMTEGDRFLPSLGLSSEKMAYPGRSSGELHSLLGGLLRSERGRVSVTVDGLSLASAFASNQQLARVAEEYMDVTTREVEALRRIMDRQEEEIVSLRQQVADLTGRLEELLASGGD